MPDARTALLLFLLSLPTGAARADLGPENAVLVVNGDSVASVTVANHYAAIRGLSASHVVVLRDLPDWRTADLTRFRESILKPTLEAVNARGLAAHTDLILYAPAVPTAIGMRKEVRALKPKPNKIFTPTGSLTGLTTLFQPVLAEAAAAILSPRANAYFAAAPVGEPDGEDPPATVGFRSVRGYGPAGEPLDEPGAGRRFLLSSVLGVTTGPDGESVEEAVGRLAATAAADGTDPPGTVVFTRTKDVRVTTREPRFRAAVAAAEAAAEARGLPVDAAVRNGALPPGVRDVVGLTSGAARADWRASGSRFAPGAFADNLTSFGGVVHKSTRQTTVADWLRAGASAAGGTVAEPYAVPFKFPSPFVHLHRLRGVTLAEAVGLSVAGPYQYLLVGDGLSNPYAVRPAVTWDPPAGPVSGIAALTPTAAVPPGESLAGWEVFAGGMRVAAAPADRPLRWNTRRLPDGVHEVAVVATLAGPVEGRGRAVRSVRVRNAGRTVAARAEGTVTLGGPPRVVWGEPLRVRVAAEGFGDGPVRAELRRGDEVFAAAALAAVGRGHAAALTVDTRPLGLGPVTLTPRVFAAAGAGKTAAEAVGAGVTVDIVPPADRPPSVPAGAKTAPGPRLTVGGESRVLADGLPPGGFTSMTSKMKNTKSTPGGTDGLPADMPFTLTAVVEAEESGLHRLAVRSNCGVRVAVGGAPAAWFRDATDAARAGGAWRSAPLWLAAGRHELTLSGRTPGGDGDGSGPAVLDVLWGRRGQVAPSGGAWRHRE